MKKRFIVVLGILLALVLAFGFSSGALGSGLSKGEFNGKNLLVLKLDGLEGFIADIETSPLDNFRALEKESLVFENFYDLRGLGSSADSEFAFNNGLYPSGDYVSYEKYGDNSYRGLPFAFSERGYGTYLFTDRENRYNREAAYEGQGFQELGYFQGGAFSSVLDSLDSTKPFYAFLNDTSLLRLYGDSYDKEPEEDLDYVEAYLSRLASLDREISDLIEGLKSKGLYDDTVLLIYGGSSNIPREVFAEELLLDLTPGFSSSVPMLIHGPSSKRGSSFSGLASGLDMFKSLSYLFFPEDPKFSFGSNVFKEESFVFLEPFVERGILIGDSVVNRDLKVWDARGKRQPARRAHIDARDSFMRDLRLNRYILDEDLVLEADSLDLDPVRDDYIVDIEGMDPKSLEILYLEGFRNVRLSLEDYPRFEGGLEGFRLFLRAHSLESTRSISREGLLGLVVELDSRPESLEPEDSLLISPHLAGGLSPDNIYAYILDGDIYRDYGELEADFVVDYSDFRTSRDLLDFEVSSEIVDYRYLLDNIGHMDFKNRDLVAHAGGLLKDENRDYSYTNSLDAFRESYDDGVRLIEIDFSWTTDNRMVCTHSWDGFIGLFFEEEVRQYSYEEFVNFQMIYDWTHLYPKRLEQMVMDYDDIYVVTDIKGHGEFDNIKGLSIIKEDYPVLSQRVIPQVYSIEEYYKAKDLGYDKIILTVYLMKKVPDQEILDFALEERPYAVTMPDYRAKTDLPSRLVDGGIFTYVHTINSFEEVLDYERNKIQGFYTDKMEKPGK